jgi:tetratricopeptide (TPR) repeat protein
MRNCYALIVACCWLLAFSPGSRAQSGGIDSLKSLLATELPDTTRVRVLSEAFYILRRTNIQDAYLFAVDALELAEKIGNHPPSLSRAYHVMGLYYYIRSDYNLSLEYNFKSLKIKESENDLNGMSSSWNNIGNIYSFQREYDKALEAYQKSLELKTVLRDDKNRASTLSNMGIVYFQKGDAETAIDYFDRSIAIKDSLDDKQGLAYTYEEVANVYRHQGKYQWALEKYQEAIDLIKGFDDRLSLANIQWNLGIAYTEMGRMEEARQQLHEALSIAKEFGDIRLQRDLLLALSTVEEQEKHPAEALTMYKEAIALRDSILSEEQSKSIIEMRTKYETEQMRAESKRRLEEETLRRNMAFSGMGMVCVVLVVLFYNYRQQQKAHRLLGEQKDKIEKQNFEITFQNRELERQKWEIMEQTEELQQTNNQLNEALVAIHEQKEQIEEQARQITDSLRYAKDIQFAILPSQSRIRQTYKELFVLNRPRDYVSGDFYWYAHHNGKAFLAVADCTGHGVPGALMSMVFNDFFDYVVNERGHSEVDEILSQLHKAVRVALKQEETLNADGMEVALCALDEANRVLEFAGAKRPIYYVQHGVMHEIRGDKKPIGGHQKEDERYFTKHTISLDTPTTFYISSDGYQDQFGGEDGKKLMSNHFRDLLFSICHEPMERQQEILQQKLYDWMNPRAGKSHHQVDDILVVGARL